MFFSILPWGIYAHYFGAYIYMNGKITEEAFFFNTLHLEIDIEMLNWLTWFAKMLSTYHIPLQVNNQWINFQM